MISQEYIQKMKDSIKQKFGEMGITDEATIQELIDVSVESLNQELEKIKVILEGNNIDNLGFHTHTIKGILLNVGLEDDAKQFQEIKHLASAGKTPQEIIEITKDKISIFS